MRSCVVDFKALGLEGIGVCARYMSDFLRYSAYCLQVAKELVAVDSAGIWILGGCWRSDSRTAVDEWIIRITVPCRVSPETIQRIMQTCHAYFSPSHQA